MALAGEMSILIPLADLIDPETEYKRLSKELERLRAELARIEAKLANDNYVSRAPADVVAKERARAEATATAVTNIQVQFTKIEALRKN
jgi:valyl-tRNA synthetase